MTVRAALGPASPNTQTPSGIITFNLTLHARHDHAFDEVLLRQEENDNHRQQYRDAGGHQEVLLGAVQVLERVEADGQRLFLHALRVDQRAEEVVPVADERKHRDRRQGGLAGGQSDVQEDLEDVATIEPGGLFELARDGQEELAQDENEERATAKECRDDQRLERVDPAGDREEDELRDHRHLRRKHHRAEDEQKKRLTKWKPQPRERERGEGGGKCLTDHAKDRDDQRILQEDVKRHDRQRFLEVVPGQSAREERAVDLDHF